MKVYFKKKISALELAQALSLKIKGYKEQIIDKVDAIEYIKENTLSFSKSNFDNHLSGIVIGPSDLNARTLLISQNPRLDFCKALNFLIIKNYLQFKKENSYVHPTSKLSKSVIIEDGVKIGADTIIEDNVVIHQNTSIGTNCIIRANSVVGAQGFGFQQDSNNSWVRFPHLGIVIIGDNVEIGALNSICVGSIGDTIISAGVKTDNLVHIAHNCKIGKNSLLTAGVILAGGVSIAENCFVGINSTIKEKVSIGKNVLVGMGSVVSKDVPEGIIIAGSPARYIRKNL